MAEPGTLRNCGRGQEDQAKDKGGCEGDQADLTCSSLIARHHVMEEEYRQAGCGRATRSGLGASRAMLGGLQRRVDVFIFVISLV